MAGLFSKKLKLPRDSRRREIDKWMEEFSCCVMIIDREQEASALLSTFRDPRTGQKLDLTVGMDKLIEYARSEREEHREIILNTIQSAKVCVEHVIRLWPEGSSLTNRMSEWLTFMEICTKRSIEHTRLTFSPNSDAPENIVNANLLAQEIVQMATRADEALRDFQKILKNAY